MKCLFKWFAPVICGLLIMACENNNNIEKTPEWSKGIVWYQIFPERFSNGDTSNDPRLSDQAGCWPHELIEPWQVHSWESDWYEIQDYEESNTYDIWYNITRRRYGGDLQGIIDKLDYLAGLGIGAIYLNPIFVAPSHHKYDIAYHHHIEPTFGPDPQGDWEIINAETPDDTSTWQWTRADLLALQLIDEVHQRGMKIIFDGVFNHVGYNNFAIRDLRQNQKKLRFKDWFTIISWDDSVTGSTFKAQGWWGIKDMPELREDTGGIVKGPRDYLYAITKRWMDPNNNGDISKGIDGWRLDVADYIGHPFWKKWRRYVKHINPEAYITAEIIDRPEKITPYLMGDEFDAVMNYNFTFLTSEYFLNDHTGLTTQAFDSLLKRLQKVFQHSNIHTQQNLIGSHDTPRASSRAVNRNKGSYLNRNFFFNQTKATNPNFDIRKPNMEELDLLKQMIAFQMTYPGSPMVYYGDEVGMWGAQDPCCRKPMVWEEHMYKNEKYTPNQTMKQSSDVVEVNHDLLDFYKKIIHVRNSSQALQKGEFETLIIDNKHKIYAFSRCYGDDLILVILNHGNQSQKIPIPNSKYLKFRELINKKSKIKQDEDTLLVFLPPKQTSILQTNTSYYEKN